MADLKSFAEHRLGAYQLNLMTSADDMPGLIERLEAVVRVLRQDEGTLRHFQCQANYTEDPAAPTTIGVLTRPVPGISPIRGRYGGVAFP